jgi:hypothetical protein
MRYSHTSGVTREYDTHVLDEKIPVVCEKCNSGWMSQITARIKLAFASQITDGSPLCILPSGIVLLAAFTFMKAIVGATHIAEKDEPFFTRAQRERLRVSQDIPTDNTVRMWISAFQGKSRNSVRFVPAMLSSSDAKLAGVQYFTVTYMVGQLLLQLLAGRRKDVRHRLLPLPMLHPDPFWDQACIQFWPPTDGLAPIEWPPPKIFDDAGLHDFVNRFKLPIHF